jgi:hypothetical protein
MRFATRVLYIFITGKRSGRGRDRTVLKCMFTLMWWKIGNAKGMFKCP